MFIQVIGLTLIYVMNFVFIIWLVKQILKSKMGKWEVKLNLMKKHIAKKIPALRKHLDIQFSDE